MAVTGLDRLRGYARRMDELHVWPGGAKLLEIAEQIERELEDERCSDVETVRSDAMEAWRWVREHGGVDELTRMFQDADNRRVELCGALGIDLDKGWSEAMAAMRLRLMPEGCIWPRFDDGEPVRFGEEAIGFVRKPSFVVDHVTIFAGGEATVCAEADHDSWKAENFVRVFPGERVRRPAVLAADGEPLEVGQTVWDERGDELQVLSIENDYERHVTCHYEGIDGIKANGWWLPRELTHQRPVLDADGVSIREGDTVYGFSGQEYEVTGLCEYEPSIVHAREVGAGVASDELIAMSGALNSCQLDALQLTHTKPEPRDSWERIEEDALSFVEDNAGIPHDQDQMERDMLAILRRCRALAERGE